MHGYPKLLMVISAIIIPAITLAKSNLHTADQLEKHLVNGCDVRAIIQTQSCAGKHAYGDSISSMDISPFNIYSVPNGASYKKVIAASQNQTTNHRHYGPVQGYWRIRVDYDNSAELFYEYLDLATGDSLESYIINCQIDKGVHLISSCD